MPQPKNTLCVNMNSIGANCYLPREFVETGVMQGLKPRVYSGHSDALQDGGCGRMPLEERVEIDAYYTRYR